MQQLRTGVSQMDRQVSELRPMEHIQGDKLRLRFVREILIRTLHAHIIVSSLSQPSHKAERNTGAGRQPHRHARCRAKPCVRRRPGRGQHRAARRRTGHRKEHSNPADRPQHSRQAHTLRQRRGKLASAQDESRASAARQGSRCDVRS